MATPTSKVIKTGDIVKFLDMLARSIRVRASRRSKTLGKSVRVSKIEEKGSVVSGAIEFRGTHVGKDGRQVSAGNLANWIERGTKKHPIKSKSGKLLGFTWNNPSVNWRAIDNNIFARLKSAGKSKKSQEAARRNGKVYARFGKFILMNYVDHPGQSPDPFISEAIDSTYEKSKKTLAASITENIKNEISLSIRKSRKSIR